MKRARLALGLLFATAAGISAAKAQVSANTMVGGTIERDVNVGAQTGVVYDSNIAHTSKTGAALQGLEASDTVLFAGVRSHIILPVGRQAVFLSGSANYNWHDKNPQLDHSRWDVTGGFANRLGPCGTSVAAGYARGVSELDNYTLVARANNVATTKRLSADITCSRPPGIGVFLGVQQAWGDNSLAQLGENEYETTGFSGGVVYGTPTRLSVSLIGTYSTTDYPNRNGLLQSEGFDVWSAGIQLERQLGARIQGSVTFNYSNAETKGGPLLPLLTSTNFEGFTYSGNLTYRASSRLSFLGSFDRSVHPTLIQGGGYEVQTNYTLRADYRLGSRFLLGLSTLQRQSDAQATSVLIPNQLTESRTRVALASLRYQQSERLSFTLNGEYEKRKADQPEFNYTGERVGLTADVAF